MTDEKQKDLPPGTYWTMILKAPKTGNSGFVCTTELIQDTRTGAKRAMRQREKLLCNFWGFVNTQRLLKIVLPTDHAKWPLFIIELAGQKLPFALTEGPLYDEQIAMRMKALEAKEEEHAD